MTSKPVVLGLLLIVALAVFAVFASSTMSEGTADARAFTSPAAQVTPPDPPVPMGEFFHSVTNIIGAEEMQSMINDFGTPQQQRTRKLLERMFLDTEDWTFAVSGESIRGELVPGGAVPDRAVREGPAPQDGRVGVFFSGPPGPDLAETWDP